MLRPAVTERTSLQLPAAVLPVVVVALQRQKVGGEKKL